MILIRNSLARQARLQRLGGGHASKNPFFLRPIRSLFIQTAETPNEHAIKFIPSMKILGENQTKEFLSGREAACSPLAVKLFTVDGVKLVMFGSDFITVEKSAQDLEWSLLKPEIFSILTEFLTNGAPIMTDSSSLTSDMEFSEEDDEVVLMIKELIFTRIRPAIMDDGGDIEFVSFREEDGTVFLRLKGACRSCESSLVTLKNGIESMLMHYIEEVKSVEPVEEDEEADPLHALSHAKAAKLEPAERSAPPNL